MTADQFWDLIAQTRADDPEEHCAALAATVSELPVEAIHVFGFRWHEALRAAYTWKLWGAAYLIGGGASDDGFEYFRDWLVLQGRDVFAAALANPDSLAKVATDADDDYQHECYPDLDAWSAATGNDDFDAFNDDQARTLSALGTAQRAVGGGDEPVGEEWDFDSRVETAKRLPQLTKLLWTGN